MSHKKILIIAPAWVGDMVMAKSLFQYLYTHQKAIIHVAAPPSTLPLIRNMPEIAKGIELPLKHKQLALKKRYQIGKTLREIKYDQVIVLPNSFKSALIPWFSKIPVRTGWKGEQRFGVLNDIRVLDKKKYSLMVERFIALGLPKDTPLFPISSDHYPVLHVPSEDLNRTIKKFHLNLTKPILALCPGAAYGPAKRWPINSFVKVGQKKIGEGFQLWLLGGQGEIESIKMIEKAIDSSSLSNFAGKTSLNEAVTILSLANIVLANDSGLMHVAAALNRPLVVIYGSTSPTFTPPLTKKFKTMVTDLPCHPCFKASCPLKGKKHMACLHLIKPEKVLMAIEELLR